MLLESRIKKAAFFAAVDISFKRMKKSPERCARNLMELVISTFPNKIAQTEYANLSQKLLLFCKSNDLQGAHDLFIKTFFEEKS